MEKIYEKNWMGDIGRKKDAFVSGAKAKLDSIASSIGGSIKSAADKGNIPAKAAIATEGALDKGITNVRNAGKPIMSGMSSAGAAAGKALEKTSLEGGLKKAQDWATKKIQSQSKDTP